MNNHVSYIQNFCLFCKASSMKPIRQIFKENTENMKEILDWFYHVPKGYSIPMESQICEPCREFIVKICEGNIENKNVTKLKQELRYKHIKSITKTSVLPTVAYKFNWNVSKYMLYFVYSVACVQHINVAKNGANFDYFSCILLN